MKNIYSYENQTNFFFFFLCLDKNRSIRLGDASKTRAVWTVSDLPHESSRVRTPVPSSPRPSTVVFYFQIDRQCLMHLSHRQGHAQVSNQILRVPLFFSGSSLNIKERVICRIVPRSNVNVTSLRHVSINVFFFFFWRGDKVMRRNFTTRNSYSLAK